MKEKKTTIYICSSCGIDQAVSLSSLQELAAKEYGVELCKIKKQLCSAAAIQDIREDIATEKPDALIIAACSPRYFVREFSFDVLTERVNLRELMAWSHKAKDEDTEMLAADNLRMSLAKVRSMLYPKAFIPENPSVDIMVVGAGVTGMTAALEGAKAGYQILLVEKEENAGGYARCLFKQLPMHAPFEKTEIPIVDKLIQELTSNTNIEFLTSSEIMEVSGQPGAFNIRLKQDGKEVERKAGAIVLANGWKPYDATKLTEFGYGQIADVISNLEFEQMAKAGKILRPSDGKVPEEVLFIQCAGSRNKEHLPYCSNYCCGTTLKHTDYLKAFSPDSKAFVIYKDIRTSGKMEAFYKKTQENEMLFMTKGEVGQIREEQSHLLVEVKDTLLGEDLEIKADMVVLALGMTPKSTEELKLNYRLGQGLPTLKYDFPDSHFICFPYETRRTGIYAAGTIRAPMDMTHCIEDARGAMLKAIQCAEATKRGESVHPRSGDKSYPVINFQRCTDCKRCTEECPFGAYNENEKGTPISNPSRCRRCGICLGACPERVISFEDFNINAVSEAIKAIHVPDEFEEKPRILAFVCENDAYPAFDMAAQKGLTYSPYLRIIPVRCLGSVNTIWISDALSKGFDGILLIGCKPGDDYQCHFIQGSELTEKRGANIQEVLTKMMLEKERIKTVFMEINEYWKIPAIIDDFVEEVVSLGPNPFKDM